MIHLFIFGALLCPLLCAAAPLEATQQEIDRREKDGDHILQEESHQYQTAVHASSPNEIQQLRNDQRFKELLDQFEVEEIRSLPALNRPEQSDEGGASIKGLDSEETGAGAYFQDVLHQGSPSHSAEASDEQTTNNQQYSPAVSKGTTQVNQGQLQIKVVELEDEDRDEFVHEVIKSQHNDSQVDTQTIKLDNLDGDLVKLITNSLSRNEGTKTIVENSEIMFVKKTPSLLQVLSNTNTNFTDANKEIYLADKNGENKDVNIKVLYLGDPETDAFIESVLQTDDVESLLQKHKFTMLKEVQDTDKDLQLETLDRDQLKKLVEETAVKPTIVEQTHDVKIEQSTNQTENSSEFEIELETEKTDNSTTDLDAWFLKELQNEMETTTNIPETVDESLAYVGKIDVRLAGLKNDDNLPEQKYARSVQIPTLTHLTTLGSPESDQNLRSERENKIRISKEPSLPLSTFILTSEGTPLRTLATTNMKDISKLTKRVNTLEQLLLELLMNRKNEEKPTTTSVAPQKEIVSNSVSDTELTVNSKEDVAINKSSEGPLTNNESISNPKEELSHVPQSSLTNIEPSEEVTLNSSFSNGERDGDSMDVEEVLIEDTTEGSMLNYKDAQTPQEELILDLLPPLATTGPNEEQDTLNSTQKELQILSNDKSDIEDTTIYEFTERPLINQEDTQTSQPSQIELSLDLEPPLETTGPSGEDQMVLEDTLVEEGSLVNHEDEQVSQPSLDLQPPRENTGYSEEELLQSSPSQKEFTSIHLSNGETLALFYSINQDAETSAEGVDEGRRRKRSAPRYYNSPTSHTDDVKIYLKPERAQCQETGIEESEVGAEPATDGKEDRDSLYPPEPANELNKANPKTKKYVKKVESNAGKRVETNPLEAIRRKRAIYNTLQRDPSYFENRLEGPPYFDNRPKDRLPGRPTQVWLRYYSHPEEALRFDYQPIVRQTNDYEPVSFNPAYFRANRGYGFNEWGGLGLNP